MISYSAIRSTALLGTSFETLATAASTAATESEVAHLSFENTHATDPVTVTVAIVNAGGTATDAFWEVARRTLQAGESWQPAAAIGAQLGPGGTVQAKASAGSAVSWHGRIRVRTR